MPPLKREASFLTKTMYQNEKANPSTSSVICGVHELESIPKMTELKKLVEKKILPYDKRFSSILIEDRGKIMWKEVPFDLERHIVQKKLPSPGNKEALEEFLSSLYSKPMDPKFPLWYIYILTNWENNPNECILLSCFHHELGDGISLAVFWDSLYEECDEEEDKERENSKPFSRTGSHPLSAIRNLFDLFQFFLIFLFGLLRALFAPLMPKDTSTILKLSDHRKLSMKKKVYFSSTFPLRMFLDTKVLVNGTVNDVFVAALSGGLRRYFLKYDPAFKKTKKARVSGVFPLTIRGRNELQLGNRFTFCPLVFPVSIEDSLERLKECKRTSDNLKRSPEAKLFIWAQKLGALFFPTSVILRIQGIMLDKFTLVFTNVPGPNRPRKLAGAVIKHLYGTVNSPIASCISLMTYNEKATFSIVADADILPFPRKLILEIENELNHLHSLYKNQKKDL